MRTLRVQDIAFTDYITMEILQYWIFKQTSTDYRQRYEQLFRKVVFKHFPDRVFETLFIWVAKTITLSWS